MTCKISAFQAEPRKRDDMTKAVYTAELDLSNRRGAKRIPVLKDGTISYARGTESMPCFVQDISETGARMQFASVDHVPANFKLTIESEDFSIECIVVWRSQTEVGVIFGSGDF